MTRVIIRKYLFLQMAVDVARYMNFRRNKIEKSTATFLLNFFSPLRPPCSVEQIMKSIVLIPESSTVAANIRGEE